MARADFRFTLPHKGFHRKIRVLADLPIRCTGQMLGKAEWKQPHREWLPSEVDRLYEHSLTRRVVEAGKLAGRIAPPAMHINGRQVDFAHVRFN